MTIILKMTMKFEESKWLKINNYNKERHNTINTRNFKEKYQIITTNICNENTDLYNIDLNKKLLLYLDQTKWV